MLIRQITQKNEGTDTQSDPNRIPKLIKKYRKRKTMYNIQRIEKLEFGQRTIEKENPLKVAKVQANGPIAFR